MENNKLLRNVEEVPQNKKLIAFDLDGTLTESKSGIDEEMIGLLKKLLEVKQVAVIGGGKYEIFMDQFVSRLNMSEKLLGRLYLFPASGTSFYKYKNGLWTQVYAHELSSEEKKKVFMAFEKTFQELGYKHPDKTFGELIEDRGTQITFTALGQEAPLNLKEKWKKEHTADKLAIARVLQQKLPDLEVG